LGISLQFLDIFSKVQILEMVCSKLQAVDHMLQHPPSGADEVISALSWQLVTAIIHNEEGDGLTL
jgi:hypothetical protein